MSRNIYPSPALIILVVCGIVISYASQQQASYDPLWLAACSLLFLAGCLLSFNIMRSLPEARVRIAMSRATWQHAKHGLGIGIACLAVAFGWLLWGLDAFRGGTWTNIAIVMVPTLALGIVGLALVYYWLGLWAFGEVQKDEPLADAQDELKE
jgi:hypothetical protein